MIFFYVWLYSFWFKKKIAKEIYGICRKKENKVQTDYIGIFLKTSLALVRTR
jgi:hypothetical protein